MQSISLKLLGIIAFLGSSPTDHFLYGTIKILVRVFTIFYLPFLVTAFFAMLCTESIEVDNILKDVERMVYIKGDVTKPKDLSKISDELKGENLYIGAWGLDENKSIVVGVALEKEPEKPEFDPCQGQKGERV